MSQADKGGSLVYVIGLAAVAAVGGFLFGFDSGVVNGTVEALKKAFGTGSAGTGFAVASLLLGAAGGAFFAGPLADLFGRRTLMLVTAVVFLVSSLGLGWAPEVVSFNVFRVLGGVGVGAASVLAPAYIAEVAPPQRRGQLGSLQQLAIVVGLFCAFLSNYLLARAAGGAAQILWLGHPAWRWMFWVEAVPALAFLVGALVIPESPRFLVAKGGVARAQSIFARIAGPAQAAELVQEVQQSLAGASRWSALFRPGAAGAWKKVGIGVGLSAFQQLVGINIIFYYGEVLWRAAGSTEGQALWNNLITGTTNIVATFIAIALIDRVGRRPLLLAGSLGMAVTLAVLALCFATSHEDAQGRLHLSRSAGLTGLVAANLYVVAFGVSWGPVVWVMLGEMFSNRYRGPALALAAAAQWLANFAVSVSFPALSRRPGLVGAYSLYAFASVLSLAFVLTFAPETKGKKLEEM